MKITPVRNIYFMMLAIALGLAQSCSESEEQSLPNIEIGNLYKVSSLKTQLSSDTLSIEYLDQSFIYDEKYNILKNNKLIYYNYDKLKSFENVTVTSKHKDYQAITRHYNKTDMKFIDDLHSSNTAFSKMTDEIVSSFDLSELSVFKHGINTINDAQGIKNQSYIDLLLIMSQADKDEVQSLPETERLRVFCDMIEEVGFRDAWSNQPIDPTPFITKISEMFVLVGTSRQPEKDVHNMH